jgi:hypothetical protein
VLRALLDAMTTDGWRAACGLFMKFVRRGKRRQAQAALDRTRQRVLRAPGQRAAEAETLARELGGLIDVERCTAPQCEQFIQSVTSLLERARPVVTAATFVQGDMLIFPRPAHETTGTAQPAGTAQPDYAEGLRQATTALKDSAEAQRALASEVAAFSRLARESQQKAHAAQVTVLNLLTIVAGLQRRIEDLTRERDDLLVRLAASMKQELDVTNLTQQLHDAQQQVLRSHRLYQRSQQELALARQRQETAEREADEATDRLARYEGAPPAAADHGPDLDDYEQALDDLVVDRQAQGDRLDDIERSLSELSPPLSPASLPLPPPPQPAGMPTAAAVNEHARGTADLADPILTRWFDVIGGLVLVCLCLTSAVFGIVHSVRDDQYSLGDLRMTGSKPAMSYYPPVCSQAGCAGSGTEELAYSLSPGRSAHTIFLVGDEKTRYLSTDLSLSSSGRSCGDAARASYIIYSNGHAISHGSLTAKAGGTIRSLPIGKHARLGFSAALHAPPGCVMSLSLTDPTLDALKTGLGL